MKVFQNRLGFVPIITIIALLLIVGGKLFGAGDFSSNMFLYWYGVTVTSAILLTFFVTYNFYHDPYDVALKIKEERKKRGEVSGGPIYASILVAAYNEEAMIRRCVDSCVNQSYLYKEIIFINDRSTDRTGEILDEYARAGKIKVIHMAENVGKKRALAEGVYWSSGNIFVFSDSDTVLALDAVEKMVAIFETHPDVGAVSGHSRVLNADSSTLTKIQDAWYEGQFSVRKAYESVFGKVQCVSGPLAVFRREAVYNYMPAWTNDTFLGQEFKFATDRTLTAFVLGSRMLDRKIKEKYKDSPFVTQVNYPSREWKVLYSKSAKAWTEVPDNFRRVLKQQVRWKKSFIRNIFFTGKFYWKEPFPVSLMYYLHILFVIIGPFIAFRHLIYLPLQGNIFSGVLYISGLLFVGFLFAIAVKLERRDSKYWMYRPLMNLISTFLLSWLVFYSVFTIRKMTWSRG